jgi:hypothetical protein
MSDSTAEIIASLFFDSWIDATPELRAESSVDDRHLIYEGKGLILDLLIRPLPDRAFLHVSGQVLTGTSESFDQVANLFISMERGESRVSTHTNAMGEFIFDAVPDGIWTLMIALSDRRLVVRGLRPSADSSGNTVGGNN